MLLSLLRYPIRLNSNWKWERLLGNVRNIFRTLFWGPPEIFTLSSVSLVLVVRHAIAKRDSRFGQIKFLIGNKNNDVS
jgi:hypothetical protein